MHKFFAPHFGAELSLLSMHGKHLSSVVVVLGCLAPLVGCGGLERRNCPNGNCETACSGDTFASGGSCVPLTLCAAGTYVAQEATATSDRICDLCPSGTFTTAENSPSCTAWRTCTPGTYVANAPSTLADRICAVCDPGTYTQDVNQAVCLGAGQCPAGTTQTSPGTDTSPPGCAPCSSGEYCAGGINPSVACTGEEWDDDLSPATPCVDKTVCGPGTYVLRAGSATVNRACSPCPGGSYNPTQNALRCIPWTDCLAGTFVFNSPAPTVDRQCSPCPADTYTTEPNQSVCLSVSDCPAGTVQTKPATATTAPECSACSKGQYCPGGTTPAKDCTDGTWDHDGKPATNCIPWLLCLPGSYISSPGSATADQLCTPCPAGSFSTVANSEVCAGYSECAPGTYVAIPPTTQSDQTCLECASGTFSADKNQPSCQMWTPCLTNVMFVSKRGTAASDQVCRPCSENGCSHYCSMSGDCFDCLDHRDCAAGLACDEGACVDLGCGGHEYFKETFASANAQWWTVDGVWDIGEAVKWEGGPAYSDPELDHTEPGTDNMLAGVVIGGIAPQVLMDERSYLTSAAVDTTSGPSPVYLEFYRWLNSDKPPFMSNTVEVWSGTQWITIWSGPSNEDGPLAENAWSQQVFDVTPYRNPYFRIRFGYVIENAGVLAVGSWNVDDIRIANTLSCPPPVD
jgi:hypothetical protein